MKRKIIINQQTLNSVKNLISSFLELKINNNIALYLEEDKLTVKKQTRSLEQNDKMWAMLTDVSNQCVHFNKKYSAEDWKDIFTASINDELRVTPTINGDKMVLLGLSTSKMNKIQLSNLIAFIQAHGDLNSVRWTA
jgi:hypothetical protein